MNPATTAPTTPSLLQQLAECVGPQGLITTPADMEPYIEDWRGIYRGSTPAIVRPATTAEVAAVVRLCADRGVAIIPQGGNTGMCGGSVPDAGGSALILSLSRMNRIREIDAPNNTLTVEAGCVLATIQDAACDADRLFPLSLGAEGSCQIGGNLSTNAGGVNVLRFGNTRDLVLGLEVVLPDGRVWNGLRTLRKDNTGYDLKHLFIGAEGTLGIITAATLKLFPRPRATTTAWIAVADPAAALRLLSMLRDTCGDRLFAYELISRRCMELVLGHIPGTRDPLPIPSAWYVLAELADCKAGGELRAQLELALAAAAEQALANDAVIAESQTQAAALWQLRETIPEALRSCSGMLYRHDISVAVSRVPQFIQEAGPELARRFPGIDIICFGHLGDGNLHYNIFVSGRDRKDAAARAAHDVTDAVYEIVHRHGGSFSAEHGVGLARVSDLERYKSAVELDLMHTIKQALDPQGLMNPGKVLRSKS